MANIQVIETVYKGYKFRSRLEARWAVFFDNLGINWEYEFEGYILTNGKYYLPDFWLPTFSGGMFAEVKPVGGDFSKAYQLCKDTKKYVWLCEGVPDIKEYDIYAYEEKLIDPETLEMITPSSGVAIYTGIPNVDQAIYEDRMFWAPGYDPKDSLECLGELFLDAVKAARQAQFEHKEND